MRCSPYKMVTCKIYRLSVVWQKHEGAIFDSFDEFHHQQCAVKHYVINELVMGRALQKHARGKNPQVTSKQRDRWSL